MRHVVQQNVIVEVVVVVLGDCDAHGRAAMKHRFGDRQHLPPRRKCRHWCARSVKRSAAARIGAFDAIVVLAWSRMQPHQMSRSTNHEEEEHEQQTHGDLKFEKKTPSTFSLVCVGGACSA
jgi:hypothetical protein